MSAHSTPIEGPAATRPWADALREQGAPRRDPAGLRTAVVKARRGDPGAGTRARPVDANRLLTERPGRVPVGRRGVALSEDCLRARAVGGDLEVQRAAYEGVRRVIDETGASVWVRVERAQAAVEIARAAEAGSADEARARGEAAVWVRAANAAFAELGERLQALRRQARAAAVDAVERVNDFAVEVAGDARAVRDRGAAVAPGSAAPLEALRELSRLVGAQARVLDDGTVEITVSGRPLVRGDGAVALTLVEVERDRAREGETGSAVLALAWADGVPVREPIGAVGALLRAAEEIVPAVHERFDEAARAFVTEVGPRFAGPEAAPGVVAPALGAPVVPLRDAPDAIPPRVSPPSGQHASGGPADRAVATLLAELSASLDRALELIDRHLDVVSSIDAVLAGPPVSQVAGMVASAMGARIAATPPERGRQDLVSALHEVQGRLSILDAAARGLLVDEPLAPLRVASTDPELLRVELVSQLVGGGVDPAAPTTSGEAETYVHSVAAGGMIASATPFAPGAVLGGGQAFDFLVVTGVGDAVREVGTRIHAGPGSTLADVAAAIQDAGAGVTARVVPAGGAAERLQVASTATGSHTGVALVDAVRTGAPPPALGGFGLVRAPADTVIDVTGRTPEAVRLTSPTRSVDGPVEGLRLTVAVGAAGVLGAIGWRPDQARAADLVGRLVAAAGSFLDASTGREAVWAPAPDPRGPAAFASDPMMQAFSARVTAALGMGSSAGELLPGVRVERGRPVFDRGAFLGVLAEEPVGTENAVRAGARELAAVAREATDLRLGALAVRIQGELESARGAAIGGTDGQERAGYRDEALQRRGEALRSLLSRLDDERSWLGSHLR